MRLLKSLFALLAVGAVLLAPLAVSAQFMEPNTLGIYPDADGIGYYPGMALAANTPGRIYFYVIMPENDGTPVQNVDAFEFKYSVLPEPSFFILSETFYGNALNVKESPEYVVGYASPVPVVGQAALVMSWEIMVTSDSVYLIYVGPTLRPSIDGTMCYQDADTQTLIAMAPAWGNPDGLVFVINEEVPTDARSFGEVKALFR